MLVVLIALYAIALLAPLIFRVIPRAGFFILAAAPLVAFMWQLTLLPEVLGAARQGAFDGPAREMAGPSSLVQFWDWVPELGMNLSFRMDTLSAFMSLIVLGVGAAVLLYCARYFDALDRKNGAFGGQLLAFAATMFGLVTTDDLLVLYIFWEITSILSFVLIGYAGHRIYARRSALTALVVTTFGGLSMLAGLVMLGHASDTYQISEILAGKEELLGAVSSSYLAWMIALILLGALTKSAQVPFHFWLPSAMAAPTPVSAYLHAAAMVKAGIFLVARFAPLFAQESVWQIMVLGVGMWTMLVGGWRALRQTDIKLVLAYGTVSQLGFLMIVNGLGSPEAAVAGLAMLLAHSLFKAPLFMVVGIIDKKTGSRDLTRLSGIGRNAGRLFTTAVIAAVSMAGIPLTLGFVAKEASLEAALTWGSTGAEAFSSADSLNFWGAVAAWAPLIVLVAGSILTVAYTLRFIWGAFADKYETNDDGVRVKLPDTPISATVGVLGRAPALVLAVLGVVFGVFPQWISALPVEFARTFDTASGHAGEVSELAAWHGFNLVLMLSVGMLVLGSLMFIARDGVARFQNAVPAWVDANEGYRKIFAKLDQFAIWLTGRTQRGELNFYLYIILAVMVVGSLAVLVFPTNSDPTTPSLPNIAFFADWILADSYGVVVLGVLMVIATFAAIAAKKRFMTVLLISVTGYGLAGIFALQGSPDLALTQLLVESIVLVAMVLGLRVLPIRVPKELTGRDHRFARGILAVGFAITMMWVAATVMASRTEDPISLAMPDLAYNEGGGTNIVNVTLVDMRAWDTFGEITVLAAAATGVASLVFIAERERAAKSISQVTKGSVGRYHDAAVNLDTTELSVVRDFSNVSRSSWLIAGPTLAPERRSIIFEVVTRLTFHTIILLSLYLLIAGHNFPGGGFAGGLLAGLALTLRYLAGGRFELSQALPVAPGIILGSGLALAAVAGLFPLFIGGEVFQAYDVEVLLPLFGPIHFASAMVFDIGVYLVVIGLVVDVLRSLGGEVDRRQEADNRTAQEVAQRRTGTRLAAGRKS